MHLLEDGRIGVIAHQSCLEEDADGVQQQVNLNTAFVYNREKHALEDFRIIGTRPCYPAWEPKTPYLKDCAFTSGMVMRPDGKADLYSGLGDTAEGRIVIDDPFADRGRLDINAWAKRSELNSLRAACQWNPVELNHGPVHQHIT